MDNQYPLTLDHVKQFLATKQDSDELGICFNAMHCLLSETLNWLYPQCQPWRVDIGSYACPGMYSLPLNPALNYLRVSFDYCSTLPLDKIPVTKAKLREYLTFLASGEIMPGEAIPFSVDELFGCQQ